MGLFSNVKDLFQSLWPKKSKKNSLEELSTGIQNIQSGNSGSDDPAAITPVSKSRKQTPEQASLLHTSAPKSFGVKKNLIIGIVCLCAAVFAGSIWAGLDGGNKSKPTNQQPYDMQGGAKGDVGKLPNSYSDLAKYNTKNLPGQPNQTGQPNQPGQPGQPGQGQPNSGNGNPNYSQIPSSGYSGSGSGGSGGGNYMEQVADYIRSPIRFALAAPGQTNQAGASGAAAVPGMSGISGMDNQNPAPTSNKFQPQQVNMIQAVPYTLQSGTLIPATLMTGVNSDLSGEVVAQVRQNVYDTVTGNYLLIPQGSRLVGEYGGGKVGNGQERIAVIWSRLYLPNGNCVVLDGMASVDGGGYPGMKDKVDNHTGRLTGATLASSVLAAGAQIAAGNTNADKLSYGQLAVQGSAANLMNMGTKLIERDLNINPTLTIRPGFVFNVFINKDLILQPYSG